MISLANAERLKNRSPIDNSNEGNLPSNCENPIDEEHRQRLAKLTFDLLNGKIRPVLRTIRSADYGLNLDQIRVLLRDLYATGILDTDIRNSYKRSDKVSY